MLWYSLLEGYPPLDVLSLEPNRTVQAGVTFVSAGIGSRPKARVGRWRSGAKGLFMAAPGLLIAAIVGTGALLAGAIVWARKRQRRE